MSTVPSASRGIGLLAGISLTSLSNLRSIGKKSRTNGGCGQERPAAKLSEGGGTPRNLEISRQVRAYPPACARQAFCLSASSGLAFSPAFGHGLCAVAAVTQLCRLLGSVKRCQSPLCGSMWSTSVARTRRSCRAHSRHHGSRSNCAGRRLSVQIGRLYQPRHRRLCAAPCAVLGSVLVTVPAPHQLPAAGMQARPQWLTCHTRACRAGRTR